LPSASYGAVSRAATRLRLARLAPKGCSLAHKRLPLGQCGRAADLVGLHQDYKPDHLRRRVKISEGVIGSGTSHPAQISAPRPASGQELFDEPPFSARCRDMGANRGAIDAVVPTVCHDLGQRNRHRLPDPSFTPAPEPPVDRVPVAILGRHIAPRRAAAQPPEYPIDDGSVLLRQATAAPVHCFNRKQALQNMPFCLGEIAPAQAWLQKAALNQAGNRSSTNLSTSPSSAIDLA
jgi:hypothetical protein